MKTRLALGALTLFVLSCNAALLHAAEMSLRDYAILSAFLRSQLQGNDRVDDIRVGSNGSVLAGTAIKFSKPLDAKRRGWLMHDLKGLTPDTLESFDQCSIEPRTVSRSFDVPVVYQIASPDETRDLKTFHAHYPDTNGYVQFSCVGVNSDETQGLFLSGKIDDPFCRGQMGLNGKEFLRQLGGEERNDYMDRLIIRHKILNFSNLPYSTAHPR